MDQKQIEEIVRSVMASMGQTAPAPSEAKCTTTNCAAPVTSESCALDLGSAEAKAWIGVENPHRADVLTELRRSTVARVCTGRAGPRPRTQALLRFLADHSRSKDTVLKEVPEEWVKAQGLLEVRSEISDKNLYLTRPDMGRRLCAEAVEALKAQCVANPDVQVVISDGLSTDAITVNYEEILGAKVVILLVGERPGLGQSESLSCYAVYSPRMATTVEADRTCISNIHQGGTPPVEAAAVIVDLAKRMLEQKASGINMTR
ncbi:ethanolamine ammonia-lyase subunit EutC [Escherichia coli]|uniref:ethanolamine ammonia-lyase subunit EutC n=1 Tax=Escherichia coli TaxID=562 RepID=UPI0007080575|nr:ethanolamine ammonia-lyase subunit EutC [Escherichia coli]KQI94803.1 ethanolamine ammonia-lyase [Escherichia coli]